MLGLGAVLIFGIFMYLKVGIPEFNPRAIFKMNENFVEYIYWHLMNTIAETIPWYWGVFNWLGVTLPRLVLKVQARILIVSSLGFLIYVFKQLRKKTFKSVNNLKILFLAISAAIYYFAIMFDM